MAEWKKVVVSGSSPEFSALTVDGTVTANAFSGDGSALTGLPAAAISAYNNAADNRVITSVDSSTVQGEANLTFDGSALGVTGNITVTGTVDGVDVAQLETDFNTLEGKTLVSGSAQIAINDTTGTLTTLGTVTSGDVSAILPSGTVSGSSQVFADVSGDVLIASNGTATIQANSVTLGTDTTGDYVASLGSGTGVTIGSNSGEGSNPTIAVNYGSSANQAVQGNTQITLTQTSGEIDITGTAAQALGGAPSYTIGLADTISGNRTFSGQTITINNDLVVQGTASFQSTENLQVADQFILLNSGSTSTGPGGIVIEQGTDDIGEALAWSSADSRWGVTGSFDAASTTFSPDAYVNVVIEGVGTDPDATPSKYDKKGNMFVGTDEEIWIYV